jgi:hypothetical protein
MISIWSWRVCGVAYLQILDQLAQLVRGEVFFGSILERYRVGLVD